MEVVLIYLFTHMNISNGNKREVINLKMEDMEGVEGRAPGRG